MHRVSMEPVRNEVDRWLTANEEERLLAASSLWLQEIIRFALNTGMRQGEILNLQWQDVDFTRGTLIVMKSKNGTRRTIPLNSTVYELLAAKQAATGTSCGPVFKTPLGNTSQVRFLVREFCDARDRLGFPISGSMTCGTRSRRVWCNVDRSVQGPTAARSQDQYDDTALCPSFAGEPTGWRERAGRGSAGPS